ncbi:MAG: hypothetical protein O7A03_01365, partial [Alphaproteobacteria bacterium]|nr:hypothetical protein [Alphaproteobacteria bacterium]
MRPAKVLGLVLLLSILAGIPARAQGDAPAEIQDLPQVPFTVIVEDQRLDMVDSRLAPNGSLLVPIEPIARILGNPFEFDPVTRLFRMQRSADRRTFTIDMNSGTVFVGTDPIGVLPNLEAQRPEALYFTPNAISIVTGTLVRRDDEARILSFSLDARLRSTFDFEIFVNGQRLQAPEPRPRAIGAVLLLPLAPIVDALGSEIEILDNGNVVQVTRIQDSARIELDFATGIIEANDRPIGVAPDIFLADPDTLLLPKEAVEALTGTVIRVEPDTNRVLIDLDRRLSDTILPSGDLLDEARDDPFTLERLQAVIGNDQSNSVRLRGHYREFNGLLRYRVPNLPENEKQFEPSFVAFEYESLAGYQGVFGDYIAVRRELRGVDISRIRGAQLEWTGNGGHWIATGGAPLDGSKELGKNFTVPTFNGVALALRHYDASGDWEAGIAAAGGRDNEIRRVVASYLRTGKIQTNTLGLVRYKAEADLGVFEDAPAGPIDARADISA